MTKFSIAISVYALVSALLAIVYFTIEQNFSAALWAGIAAIWIAGDLVTTTAKNGADRS